MKRLSILLVICLLMAGVASAQEWHFGDVSGTRIRQVPNATAVAWGDVNNDGRPDLMVAGTANTDARLFINSGYFQFTDATAEYNIPSLYIKEVRRMQWLDVNGDGFLDLFVMMDNSTQVKLYEQRVNHQFQVVPLAIEQPFINSVTSAAWLDVNGDGQLDLVLSSGTNHNEAPLVLQQHSGQFVQMRDNLFADGLTALGALAPCDYNKDGQVDVFTGFGPTEEAAHLYRRTGNGYLDWAEKCGISPKGGASSAVWIDGDNDLWPDLFVLGAGTPAQYYRNIRIHAERLLQPAPTPRALLRAGYDGIWADALDVNMDGWTDLFVIRSNREGCSLVINREGQEWGDVAQDVGIRFEGADLRSAAWADCDGDGDPDLAVALGNGGVRLFKNTVPRSHDFIRVNLLGTGSINTPVSYALVEMIFENSKQIAATAPVICNSGGNASTLLFVNRNDGARMGSELVVRWPNGIQQSYPASSLNWNGTTNLHMPAVSAPPPSADVPETPVAGEIMISPNPFNPTTNLSFTLTNTATVSLMIYDMLGRQVADLAHGPLGTGEHRVTFDASALPSGMYFSRLTVNGVPTVKRLMLAK
jgi:hypothetical protein